jgi:hypothetical protein
MNTKDIADAAERVAHNQSLDIQSDIQDFITLAVAYVAEKRERDLTFRVNEMAAIERAVMGQPNKPEGWPDWVYEARRAVKVAREANPAWLPELLAILDWQGGTVHQALNAIRRMVESEKEREAKRNKFAQLAKESL